MAIPSNYSSQLDSHAAGVESWMAPRPEVTALRALIVVGCVIVGRKVVLRHYNIKRPPPRH